MLKRLQHEGFGNEIRALLCSSKTEDKRTAGIILEELDALAEARSAGRSHPAEERLNGEDLRDIQYLKLYKGGQSIRVYFTTLTHIWMIALDCAKRKTALSDAVKERLIGRLRDVRQKHEELLRAAKREGG